MNEVVVLDQLKQAKALLHPVRVRLLDLLETPRTCRELAELVGQTQQRLNHHLKEMVAAGLVQVTARQKKKNLLEATYLRTGKAYWFSPQLARAGGASARELRDRLSLSKLLVLAETLSEDAGRLLSRATDTSVPSLALDAEVTLRSPEERQEFTRDVLRALHSVLEKYQATVDGAERYRVVIGAYPTQLREDGR